MSVISVALTNSSQVFSEDLSTLAAIQSLYLIIFRRMLICFFVKPLNTDL